MNPKNPLTCQPKNPLTCQPALSADYHSAGRRIAMTKERINMIIGYDANEANVDKRVGSGQYAFEILRNMVAIGQDRDDFYIYLKNPPKLDFPQPTLHIKYKVIGPKPFWTQVALPFNLYTAKRPNVVFSPAHYAPRFCPVPSVITIHDLSYVSFKDYFLQKDIKQLESWTKYSVKQAKHIIVPSQATKNDLVSFYHYPKCQVTVIPHGYDDKRFHDGIDPNRQKQILQNYAIKHEYMLYLGTLQPRKNLVKLIEAYKQALGQFPDLQFVIVGKRGWLYDDIFTKIKEFNLDNKIIFTDFVPDENVPYFYAGAKFYILPSLYEGFGMPLIEAMACGTPVAASNTSSLPEVVGPGYTFDSQSSDAMAKTITKIMQLSENDYQALKQKSIDFAKMFSWQKAAKETLAVLEKVAQ